MALEFETISSLQVNTFETGPQTLVGSTALLGGGYVVLWETYTEDGLSKEILGQSFSSSGEPVGDNFRVTDRSVLSVTQGNHGGFIVQYAETEAQLFDATGVAGDLVSLDANDWRNHDNMFLLENGNTVTVSVETRELPFGEFANVVVGNITTPEGIQYSLEELQVGSFRYFESQPRISSFYDGSFALTIDVSSDRRDTSDALVQRYDLDGTLDGETYSLDLSPLWENRAYGFDVAALSSDTMAFLTLYEGNIGDWTHGYYGPVLSLTYPDALLGEGEAGIEGLKIEAERNIRFDMVALGEDRLVYFWETASAGQDSELFANFVGLFSRPDQMPAEGSLSITGEMHTGARLEAITDTISDANGLSDPGFAFQWYRTETPSFPNSWVEIPGATDAFFSPTMSEYGHVLRVEATFQDDAGFTEVVMSESDRTSERVSGLFLGTAAQDVIFGAYMPDTLQGLDGDDRLFDFRSDLAPRFSRTTSDVFHGGNGNDTLISIGGYDTLYGEEGNDYLIADAKYYADNQTSGGNVSLYGGDGLDTLVGGDGNDFISGGDTELDLRDVIFAGDGDDVAGGGYGNDLIYGQDGHDRLFGGFGADELVGQNGNDELTGGALSDVLFGGAGTDFLNGGFGSDRLNGGPNNDWFFHLGVADHGSDWIQDYSSMESDALIFGGTGSIDQFQVNFANTAGAGRSDVDDAFVIYRPTGQILWALVDGEAESRVLLSIGGNVYDLLA